MQQILITSETINQKNVTTLKKDKLYRANKKQGFTKKKTSTNIIFIPFALMQWEDIVDMKGSSCYGCVLLFCIFIV